MRPMRALLRGFPVMALISWAWVGYVWIGDVVCPTRVSRGDVRHVRPRLGDPALARLLVRFAPTPLVGTLLLLMADRLDGAAQSSV